MRTSFEEGTYHRQAFKTTQKKKSEAEVSYPAQSITLSREHHVLTISIINPTTLNANTSTQTMQSLINMRELNVVVVGGMESMCMLEGENERERVCICVFQTQCVCVYERS